MNDSEAELPTMVHKRSSIEKSESGFYYLPIITDTSTSTRFNEFVVVKPKSRKQNKNKRPKRAAKVVDILSSVKENDHDTHYDIFLDLEKLNVTQPNTPHTDPAPIVIDDKDLLGIRRLEGIVSPRAKESESNVVTPAPLNTSIYHFPKTPQEEYIQSKHYNNKYFHQYIDVKIPVPVPAMVSLEDMSGFVTLEDSQTSQMSGSVQNHIKQSNYVLNNYNTALNMNSLANDSSTSVHNSPDRQRQNNVLYDNHSYVLGTDKAEPPKTYRTYKQTTTPNKNSKFRSVTTR